MIYITSDKLNASIYLLKEQQIYQMYFRIRYGNIVFRCIFGTLLRSL